VVRAGWEVSGRRSTAALRLTDCTPLSKVLVRADAHGATAAALGVRFGQAARDEHGVLVVGSGPGEWLLVGPPGAAPAVASRVPHTGGDFVSVVDLTHGRALMRITGASSAAVLSKVCGIDFSDQVTPNGAALRSSVAKLVTDLIRDDLDGQRSYLLHCERSSGQYLFDAVLDAGAELAVDVDGFVPPAGRST
jgi:heterotetrameric sarcosine oxidase gamma subunit